MKNPESVRAADETIGKSSKRPCLISHLVQFRMRLALKTKIPAARIGKISKVAKPIILSFRS